MMFESATNPDDWLCTRDVRRYRRPDPATGACGRRARERRKGLSAALLGLLVGLCTTAVPATAAGADKGEANAGIAVQIEANRGQLNDKTGVSTYTGNVVVTRGKLTLMGDKLVITRSKNGKDYVANLTGSPAHLDQKPNAQVKQRVTGTSHSIHYLTAKQMATLTGDAVLHQGKDVLRGEQIHYNVRTRQINADSGNKNNKGRVKVILHPRNNSAGDNAQ